MTMPKLPATRERIFTTQSMSSCISWGAWMQHEPLWGKCIVAASPPFLYRGGLPRRTSSSRWGLPRRINNESSSRACPREPATIHQHCAGACPNEFIILITIVLRGRAPATSSPSASSLCRAAGACPSESIITLIVIAAGRVPQRIHLSFHRPYQGRLHIPHHFIPYPTIRRHFLRKHFLGCHAFLAKPVVLTPSSRSLFFPARNGPSVVPPPTTTRASSRSPGRQPPLFNPGRPGATKPVHDRERGDRDQVFFQKAPGKI